MEPWHTWRLRSCSKLGGGSWSHRTRGGSRAALCQKAGAGATGHDGSRAALCQEARDGCNTLCYGNPNQRH
jgi:hypothetical protein